MDGRRADALVGDDAAPEALVHQQDARHRDRLVHSQRLDGGAQPAVDDERVHMAEEIAKVGALHLEEAASLPERGGARLERARHRVRLPFAHVYGRVVRRAVGEHTRHGLEHAPPRDWHR